MAQELKITLKTRQPRPKDAAHELSFYLGTPEVVSRALDRLREPEREALARLQRQGGHALAKSLKVSLLQAGVAVPTPRAARGAQNQAYEAKASYSGKPCFEDILARLAVLGLVLSEREARYRSAPISFSPAHTVFIPQTVLKLLPPPPPLAPAWAQAELVAAGSARQFQRDLGRYWRFVRRAGELRLTTQGYLYKADAKAIQAAMGQASNKGEQDNARLYFIRAHLTELRLLERAASGLTPSAQAGFWTRPAAERIKASFEAWRDGDSWNELLRIPVGHSGYDHRKPAPPQLPGARQVVLKHMAALGQAWIGLNELASRIALDDYEFLFSRDYTLDRPYYYYYSPVASTPYYGSNNPYNLTFDKISDEMEGWLKVETGFIGAILAGPLFWMGLVDLGGKDTSAPASKGPPQAYRLTELGTWVLGIGAPVEIAEEGGRVVVQPNFQVMALEPVSDRVLGDLDEFAEAEGGDRALLYRLTRASVYRGQRAGWDVPRIVARLEALSAAPLPSNVRRSLDEWHALHNRIVIHRDAALLLSADAAVLDELLSDPRLAGLVGRRVAPEIALPAGKANELEQALRQSGWPALVTPRGQDDGAASVRLDESGQVSFLQPTPSLGARARLASLVEGERITPHSVKAAIKAGRSVEAILADLRAVHAGDLPRELVLQIKAWGGYYGQGALAQVTLLQVRDKGVLAELCADAELAPYLRPFEAGERALALVEASHVERVRALLARRGIALHDTLLTGSAVKRG